MVFSSAPAVFIHQDELHIHGIGVAQRDRGLHPLEQNLELTAERIGPGFELAEIQHACLFYNGCRNLIVLVAELIAQRQFHLTEKPIEDPGPGEVQVRVGAVGICGSDIHSYAEGAVGDTPCEYPMVLGHEPAGTVVKTGAGVTGWARGRPRGARAGALLLSLRVLPHRASQRLRQYPLPEQPGHPGLFPRVRQSAGDAT